MGKRTNTYLQNTTQKTKDGTTFEPHKIKLGVISSVAGINGKISLKSAQVKWRGKYAQHVTKASKERKQEDYQYGRFSVDSTT